MADKDFVVKNGLVVNTGFAANSTQFTLNTIGPNSGIFANSTVITIGNSTVNVTVNSTSFSGNAATLSGDTLATIKGYVTTNASAAYTNATTFSANATNLTNGTIPYARLDVNVINTTAAFTRTGTTTFSNNIIVSNGFGINANGSYGNSGQALLSNGSSIYWATATAGSNTYIQFNDSGNAGANASFTYDKTTNTISIGNSTVNTTVNSTSFSGSAAYVGGNTAATLRTYSEDKAANAYSNATSYAANIAGTAYTNATSYAATIAGTAYSNAVSYVNSNPGNYANATNSKGINGNAATATNATTATTATYLSTTAQTNQINVQAGQGVGTMLTSTASLGGIMVQNGGGANAAFMSFHRAGSYAGYFGIDTDNQFAVGGWSAGAGLNYFKCLGLGVGTAAIGGGAIAATGDIYSAYSDERLKTKLGPITDALSKVKSLNGFFYQPNDTALALGFNDKIERRVGVSAQEIQAVLPEAVHPAPKDNSYLTVQYEKIVPLLIEAIKELSAKLEDKRCSNCSCGGK